MGGNVWGTEGALGRDGAKTWAGQEIHAPSLEVFSPPRSGLDRKLSPARHSEPTSLLLVPGSLPG